jgi:hypothetical protein
MEYVNIISKEAITAVPTWLAMIGAVIAILGVLSTFIYWAIVKDANKVVAYLLIV